MITKLLFILAAVITNNITNKAICQDNYTIVSPLAYASPDLQVCENKTTSLIFPYNIKNINQGSTNFISWQEPGSDNILQVKAGKDSFRESNLSVTTSNANLYSFLVNYNNKPANLTFHLSAIASPGNENNSDILFSALPEAGQVNEDIMSTSSKLFSSKKRILFGLHDRNAGQTVKLLGIYSRKDVIYFHLQYKNASGRKPETDNIHLYIHEQYGSKQTGARLVEIKPVFVFGYQSIPSAAIQGTCIIAVPKFTIPYAKYCEISVNEKAGDDGLSLKVYNDLLISARNVPE